MHWTGNWAKDYKQGEIKNKETKKGYQSKKFAGTFWDKARKSMNKDKEKLK